MIRGAGFAAAGVLLAACPALAATAGGDAGSGTHTVAAPPRPTADQVIKTLGVANVRAEIVLLVDISLSMGDHDLYSAVSQDIDGYLGVLAQQDKQDLVGIVAFGSPADIEITDPGPPSTSLWVPRVPFSQETDFGAAFGAAVRMLRTAPTDVRAGAVLLLSDGELSVPAGADPVYGTGFSTPGWQKLRAEVRGLPMPVTAYDVPLTGDPGSTANQHQALSQVFPSVQTLPSGTADLSNALGLATQGILDSEVASAAAPDIGQGVQVTWGAFNGAGEGPLNLAAGKARLAVTLTAMTRKIPLYITGVSVMSVGLPVAIHGTVPGGYLLGPGESAPLSVPLTWRSRSSGETLLGTAWRLPGRLRLSATVWSPFTPVLRSAFADTGFWTGGIQGGISPPLPMNQAARWNILLLAGIGTLFALTLIVGGVAAGRGRLSGTLILTWNGTDKRVPLRGWRTSERLDGLMGKPARMVVRRSARDRKMRLWVWIEGRDPFHETLPSGERVGPGGIRVKHEAAVG